MNPPARYSACIKAFHAGIIKKYGSYLYHSFRTDVAEGAGFEPAWGFPLTVFKTDRSRPDCVILTEDKTG